MRRTYGRVAQLDRVLASEAKGRGFESRLVYQEYQALSDVFVKCLFLFPTVFPTKAKITPLSEL